MPFGNALVEVWRFVMGFFSAFGELVASAWKDVLSIFTNLGEIVNVAFASVFEFFGGIGSALYDMGNQLWLGLRDGIVAGMGWISSVFTVPMPAWLDTFRSVVNDLTSWKLKIPKPSWLAGGGWVNAAQSYLASGGPVYAANGYFQPRGTDSVPAMLTPGEFVVSREPAQANAGLLTASNSSRGPLQTGGNSITLNVTINAKTNLTPDQVRSEVVPVIERALKRKSLDGGFVIAGSGVRA
jgi:hypothetical protein